MTIPEKHQLKVARETLKKSELFASLMGGPSRKEAMAIIKRLTKKRGEKKCIKL